MNKFDKLINTLSKTYIPVNDSETNSHYYVTPQFKIRLSNHLPVNTKTDILYILVSTDYTVITVSYGYGLYAFTSVSKVLDFIKSLTLMLPIFKGMAIGESLYTTPSFNVTKYRTLLESRNNEIKRLQKIISGCGCTTTAQGKINTMKSLLSNLTDKMTPKQLAQYRKLK